jgi:hypothetical protein
MAAEQKSLLALGADQRYWDSSGNSDDPHEEQALADACLWSIFSTGETCWWLPVADNPANWLVVIVGHGWQQLNISTVDFLHRWVAGILDLPVLSHGAVPREWHIDPAGRPIILIEYTDTSTLPGTLTNVLVADLTRVLHLGYTFIPNDRPEHSGPDAQSESW